MRPLKKCPEFGRPKGVVMGIYGDVNQELTDGICATISGET
jgi:hypothetical protein